RALATAAMRFERTDPSIRIHRSPYGFLDGFEALPFFAPLAFGFRASLFERIWPLAIAFPFDLPLLFERLILGPRADVRLEPLEQLRPRDPHLRAALERASHMFAADDVGSPRPIVE